MYSEEWIAFITMFLCISTFYIGMFIYFFTDRRSHDNTIAHTTEKERINGIMFGAYSGMNYRKNRRKNVFFFRTKHDTTR